MKLPVVLINYKTYIQATGKGALNLTKICEKIIKEFDINIIVAAQAVDIFRLTQETEVPIYAQHIDPIEPGSNTGFILPEAIVEAGANGTLLNHAEHKIKLFDLETALERLKNLKLETCICAANPETSGAISTLNPTFVAFELPSLIGTGISISTTEPDLVEKSVNNILKFGDKVIPLCGAGVSTGDDVYAALKLKTRGVLLASAFTKAKDPEKILIEIANAIKKYQNEI
ncbi:MAG: triose-phosphate isomerase [Candidatus Lokiarchaeota archaeon]|nr:triose-phosphate isomerase [Candidatus Lokiarchaeota archaeon]